MAGFAVGMAIWIALSAPYGRLLAWLSEPLIRMTERPPVTRLIADGDSMTIDRSDFPRSSPRPALPFVLVASNFILLITLFAVSPFVFGDRNVRAFLLGSLALMVVHVSAIVANVESIYAVRLGPWSALHYGVVARNFWGVAAHFYSVVGAFGAAAALWWLLRPAVEDRAVTTRNPSSSSRASRRRRVPR
jgi:hypothetical protein